MNPGLLREIVDRRFEVLRLIGEGGYGAVYLARQTGLDRLVALKIIHPDMVNAEVLARFEREAKILCSLQHPNICQFYAYGVGENSTPYLAMEYMEGTPLSSLLTKETLSCVHIISIAMQCCEALTHAQHKDVIHRDLKPSNIMLVPSEHDRKDATAIAKLRIKLLDFGLAKLTSAEMRQSLTVTGFFVGTPGYASPEQCLSQPLDHRSDIYSLGCILYEMVAGKPPFIAANEVAIMEKQVYEEPDSIAEFCSKRSFPEQLGDCIETAMSKNPADRYQTTEAFRLALAECLWEHERNQLHHKSIGSEKTEAKKQAPSKRLFTFATSKRNVIAISATALVALSATAGMVWWSAIRSPRQAAQAKAGSALPSVSGNSEQPATAGIVSAQGAGAPSKPAASQDPLLSMKYVDDHATSRPLENPRSQQRLDASTFFPRLDQLESAGDYTDSVALIHKFIDSERIQKSPNYAAICAACVRVARDYRHLQGNASNAGLEWDHIAVRVAKFHLPPDHQIGEWARFELACALHLHHDYADAASMFKRDLQLREAIFGPRSVQVAEGHYWLAHTLGALRQYKESAQEFGKSLALFKSAANPPSSRIADAQRFMDLETDLASKQAANKK